MLAARWLLLAALPPAALLAWRLLPKPSKPKRLRKPSKPKRLILVRHGESQGNVDQTIYASVPDHALHLTERGWTQALCAGKELRRILGDERTVWYVSPYVRTRETLHAIAQAFGGLDALHWKEDPRIREQDFGNYQNPERMAVQKEERWAFGQFYYRFPDGGESCADVYDRVSSFMESLYRYWGEHREVENYVLVIHGITVAVFLMRFFKYSVDEFAIYKNFSNCELAVLERGPHGWLEFSHCVRNETGTPERRAERAREPEKWQTKREMRYE